MYLEKEYLIQAKKDSILSFLKNPEQFSACVPNLVKYEKLSETSFRLFVTQKFVFLKSNLTMDWALLEQAENFGKLKITGKGIGSTFEALADLTFEEKGSGTMLYLSVDISTAGLLRPVPESVILAAAGVLADEIFACVEKKCNSKP